jgi:hypothetical protein
MKLNLPLYFTILLISFSNLVHAVNKTWTNGNNTGLWNDAANWSPTGVPSSADDVQFDATSSDNCFISTGGTVQVAAFTINSGYGGIVSQNAGTPLEMGDFVQAGGSFVGSSSAVNSSILIEGTFTKTGGTYTATNGKTTIGKDFGGNVTLFLHAAGTFIHGGGEIEFNSGHSLSNYHTTINADGLIFNDLIVNIYNTATSNASSAIFSGSNIQVQGDLTHEDGVIEGTLYLQGDLSVNSGASSGSILGGTGWIVFNGSSDQYYSILSGSPRTVGIEIDKPSGSVLPLVPTDDFSVGRFKLTGGTFVAPQGIFRVGINIAYVSTNIFTITAGTFTHSNGTFIFDPICQEDARVPSVTLPASGLSLYDLQIDVHNTVGGTSGSQLGVSGGEITVLNDLHISDGSFYGIINLHQDFTADAEATEGSSFSNLGYVKFVGTTDQYYGYTSTDTRIISFEVDKTSGSVLPTNPTGNLFISKLLIHNGDFHAPSGELHIGRWYSYTSQTIYSQAGGSYEHNNGITVFDPTHNEGSRYSTVVAGSSAFNQVVFDVSNSLSGHHSSIRITNDLEVGGDFLHEDGGVVGNISLKGDLLIGEEASSATGWIKFTHPSNNQTYGYVGAVSFTAGFEIDKAAGQVLPLDPLKDLNISRFALISGSFVAPQTRVEQYLSQNTATIFQVDGGSFDANGCTWHFSFHSWWGGDATIDLNQAITFNNVELDFNYINNSNGKFVIDGEMLVNGNLLHEDGPFEGTINLKGDLLIGSEAHYSNGWIKFTHASNNQTYGYVGPVTFTGSILVDKASGAVQPLDPMTDLKFARFSLKSGTFIAPQTNVEQLLDAQTATMFEYTGGVFDANGSNWKLGFTSWWGSNATLVFDVTPAFNDLSIDFSYSGGGSSGFSTSGTASVQGNFTHMDGGLIGGTWEVHGNVIIESEAAGGSAKLTFSGAGNQTYTDNGGNEPDGDVTIRKSGGNLTLFSGAHWHSTNQDIIEHSSNLGTFVQGSHRIYTRNWYHNNGIFQGGTGDIYIYDALSIRGNTFNSTSGSLYFDLPSRTITFFNLTSGTFNANGGHVRVIENNGIGGHAGYTYTFSNTAGSTSLQDLTVDLDRAGYGSHFTMNIPTGQEIVVNGDFNYLEGTLTGNISAKGNVTHDLVYQNINGFVTLNGAGNQVITGTNVQGRLPNVIIDKVSGNVTCSGDIGVHTLTLTNGNFVAPNGTLYLGDISSGYSISDLELIKGNPALFEANGGTVYLKRGSFGGSDETRSRINQPFDFHDFTFDAANSGYFNPPHLHLNNGVRFKNGFTMINGLLEGEAHFEGDVVFQANTDGGTGAMYFEGSNNQTYESQGGDEPDGMVTVSKSGGSVTLLSDANWNANGQQFAMLPPNSGVFNNSSFALNTNELTVREGTFNGGSGDVSAKMLKIWPTGTINLPTGTVTLGAGITGATAYDFLILNGTVTHTGSGSIVLKGSREANIVIHPDGREVNKLVIDKGAATTHVLGDLTMADELELIGTPSVYCYDHAIETHDLTLEGTLYFEDNGSLVQTSGGLLSGTGAIDYQRKGLNYQAGFNLWSSPIVQADLFTVFQNSNQCVLYGFDQGQQLWRFDLQPGQALGCTGFPTMNTTWSMGGSAGYTVDGKMDVGLGYAATGSTIANDDIRTFTGKPNNGVITVPVRATSITTTNWDLSDWNLLGNPYPCGLSMSDFWQENAVNNTRIEGGLYFMVDPGPGTPQYHQWFDFAVYNGIGFLPPQNTPTLTDNGHIGAGQAFWVDAVGAAGTVSNVEFNNSMRSGTNDKFYKRGNNLSNPDGKVYLSISHSSFTSNQVLIGTKFDATMGRDAQYDAEQGYEGVMPPVALMTMIGRKGYVIQGIPPIDPDTYREIPLYVHTIYDGLHTFEVNNMEKFSGYTMYIEDRVKGTQTEINPGTGHSVRMMKGDYPNRFYLVIEHGKSSNTTIKNIADEIHQSGLSVTPIGGGVVTYQQGEKLVIDALASESEISTVDIFDVVGRRVYSSTGLGQKLLEIEKNGWTEGIYVISLGLTDGTNISEKVALVQ